MTHLRNLSLMLALAISFVAVGLTPASGQVPPRFYWKSLSGGNGVPVLGMFLNGNANPLDPGSTVLDASFEANVAIVRLCPYLYALRSGRYGGCARSHGPALGWGDCRPCRLAVASLLSLAAAIAWPQQAVAHVQGGEAAGFLSGILHPVSGLDHVLAMISVGLWGAQLGAPALWLLPVTFPMVMAFGGMLGLMGLGLPGVEIGIAV